MELLIKKTLDFIINIISQNISAITGLLGVYLGALLTKRQEVTQRKLEFCEKQVRELYSPLVGMRKEIKILSEFRCEGEKAEQEWWGKISSVPGVIPNTSSRIKYDSGQLIGKMIPEYRRMVNIIKENFWLAKEETIEHYPILVKFVETWERYLSKSHPMEVIKSIQVKEDELLPFYESNESILKELKEKLKTGKC